MSINNSGTISSKDVSQLQDLSLDTGSNQLPDASVLQALASTYFPEFSSQGKEVLTSASAQTVQHPIGISASDFVRAIPSQTQGFDGSKCQALKYSKVVPFSFLTEVRGIFTEIEKTVDHQISNELHPVVAEYNSLSTTIPDFNTNSNISSLSFTPKIVPAVGGSTNHFDVQAIRRDFPILAEKVNGKNLIWFDNAATTHKPKSVIDRLTYFYEHENSNIHRGAHTLAARATDAYEEARDKVGKFLNASSSKEIVFVRGATEAINLVAQSWGKYNFQKDDEIIVSLLEHHANIVPWQMICAETGAKLRVIPVDDSGQLLLGEFKNILSPKTKLVAVTHVSNVLGTITPVAQIVQMAHRYGAKVLIDGAQAVSHVKVDVQALDCDFYVFSGHKIFAPTGIGALYGKYEILSAMHPYQGGGNMIADVTFEKTVYQDPPNRFQAGTGNIADAVGLGAAIDYVNSIGIDNINRYDHRLLQHGMEALLQIPGLRLIGTATEKASVLSFVLDGFTSAEIGDALSNEGIAVRAGHHCAQPILRRFSLEAAVRPSLAFYNTFEEIDVLVSVIRKLIKSRTIGN